MSSRKNLTYWNNLHYNVWRESDESKPYNLEEHEEQQYEISILLRYIIRAKNFTSLKEECTLTIESEEVMMKSDGYDELRKLIHIKMTSYGVENVHVRERMVDVLMKMIWDEGVGYCRCYCDLSCGPKIVAELLEIVDGGSPIGSDD